MNPHFPKNKKVYKENSRSLFKLVIKAWTKRKKKIRENLRVHKFIIIINNNDDVSDIDGTFYKYSVFFSDIIFVGVFSFLFFFYFIFAFII